MALNYWELEVFRERFHCAQILHKCISRSWSAAKWQNTFPMSACESKKSNCAACSSAPYAIDHYLAQVPDMHTRGARQFPFKRSQYHANSFLLNSSLLATFWHPALYNRTTFKKNLCETQSTDGFLNVSISAIMEGMRVRHANFSPVHNTGQ